ncbi:MAG: DUF6448 family protein [Bacteroidales bacterium]
MKTKSLTHKFAVLILLTFLAVFGGQKKVFAHCDSYDGPVILDAVNALKTNNVNLILKWVEPKYEIEIKNLFSKTYSLKSGDKEIYQIVEKHFFETLVRLHREGEGAPFTGLKAAGTTTPIVKMADGALNDQNIDDLLSKLNAHINKVIQEKYKNAIELGKVKEESLEKGRQYVKAYVDYVHTLEAIHKGIETDHSSHNH